MSYQPVISDSNLFWRASECGGELRLITVTNCLLCGEWMQKNWLQNRKSSYNISGKSQNYAVTELWGCLLSWFLKTALPFTGAERKPGHSLTNTGACLHLPFTVVLEPQRRFLTVSHWVCKMEPWTREDSGWFAHLICHFSHTLNCGLHLYIPNTPKRWLHGLSLFLPIPFSIPTANIRDSDGFLQSKDKNR